MSNNKTAGRKKLAFALLLIFGPAFLLVFIGTRGCNHQFKVPEDYGSLQNYQFTDITGKQRTAADFKNEVVLINVIQPTCPEKCSISIWHLDHLIYQHIYNNRRKQLKQVRIISFVVDENGQPLKDLTPINDMLEDQVEHYDPSIWVLASGEVEELYNVTHNGKNLLDFQEAEGNNYQELMLLADKQNHLRMVLPGGSEGMIRRMKEHIALLQKHYDKK